mgnify:FL=1
MSIKKVDVFQVDIEEEIETKKHGLEIEHRSLYVVADLKRYDSYEEIKKFLYPAVDEYFKKYPHGVKSYKILGCWPLDTGIFIKGGNKC